MIINSYNVAMNSSRKSNSVSTKETEQTRKNSGSGVSVKSYSRDVLTISEEAREYLAKNRYKSNSADTDRINENGYDTLIDDDKDAEDGKDKKSVFSPENAKKLINSANSTEESIAAKIDDYRTLRLKALIKLLESITQNRKNVKNNFKNIFQDMEDISYTLKSLKRGKNIDKGNLLDNNGSLQMSSSSSGNNTNVWRVETKESVFVKEEEVTSFSSTGVVKTADGRSISFNVNVEMSRNFEQYMENYKSEEIVLRDPLVINLDSAPANISDQTFFFDIDADGKKDEISMLGKGSGFLALDKNNDGVINDGSELFGALTGNGFEELAKYDDDGNGWIDEADEIFTKLKVWTKDENGKDILLSLKDADLGAIYLNSVSTEFSVNNIETNQQNAQVRSTGIYLKESGGSGSIQQIDFAVKAK